MKTIGLLVFLLFSNFSWAQAPATEAMVTESEAREFCRHWFAALRLEDREVGGQVELLLEQYYTPRAILIDPNFADPQVGTQNVGAYYRAVLSKYPYWEFKIEEIVPSEKGFVLHYSGSVPGLVKFFRGVDIIELERDSAGELKIAKLVGIYDRTPFIQAEQRSP